MWHDGLYENGEKDGKWTLWGEDGQVGSITFWEKGLVIKKDRWDENGEKVLKV